MPPAKRVLFIGNFLSGYKGNIGPSEKLASQLSDAYKTRAVSKKRNKFLRITDIILAVAFSSYNYLIIDVYSTQAFLFAEIAAALGKLTGRRIILVLHGGGLADLYEQSPQKVMRLYKKADKLVTPSIFLKEYFEEKGFKVTLIPNSIDLATFAWKRDAVKPYSLLWVRAFRKIYNPEIAIETLDILKNKFPGVTLTMVGPDDGLMEQCKQLARSLNVEDRVTFEGSVKNDALPQYYHTHQVYLNTTSLESFGVAVMEAASCGIPVISSNVGGIKHIWNDSEIIAIDNITPQEFAVAAEELFTNNEKAAQLALNAAAKAKQYGWEAIKPQWINLLESI